MVYNENVRSNVKPSDIKFDAYHVYVAENIHEINMSDEIDGETHNRIEYEYNEYVYDKDEYLINKLTNIDKQISFLANKQGYSLVQTSENVFEFVKDNESNIPTGDYINPITYTTGMSVETGKFYTDGDNIWEAMKDGVPTGFDDEEYFDIIK